MRALFFYAGKGQFQTNGNLDWIGLLRINDFTNRRRQSEMEFTGTWWIDGSFLVV